MRSSIDTNHIEFGIVHKIKKWNKKMQ